MRKLFPTAIAAFLAASCACVAAGAPQQAASSPVVQIQSGKVRGIERNGIMTFKAIPFAQPPVGDLRWAPPRPAKPWDGVRDAADYGHDCMQLPVPDDDTPLLTTPSEDCLYLNVWAPERATKPLPVMVWIYGGGFVSGGTSPAVTSGANFARDGIVFVSFNYRVGRFGFFAFPALVERGGLVGNYAFMDQIATLKWVRRNIRAFGGNPFNVTIFGESAGGMSVNLLLTSPLARGLFNQAMIESGAGRANLLGPLPLDRPGSHGQRSAVEDGIAFAKSMGIEGTGADALAALHALLPEKIVNGLSMASMRAQGNTYSGPMVDGKIMVQPPEDVFRAGQEAKVPLVVGANTRDIGFARPETLDELFKQFGAREAEARKVFDPSGDEPAQQVGYKIAATNMMIEPARFVARSLARAGAPAYQYRFGYVASALRNNTPAAPHSSEVPYVFDTIRESVWSEFGKGITQQDLATARDMHAYWVNFVKTGDPNGPGLPSWATITPDGNQLMYFTKDGPKGGTDPWKDRLDLVEPLQH